MKRISRRLAPTLLVALAATAVGLLSASSAITAPGDTANLKITKSDSPDPVTVGSLLTYTIEVSNSGPDAATKTTVRDRLPLNVDFVSATSTNGTCKQAGRTVTCQVGRLAQGDKATITLRVRPKQAGTITNTATVDSVETDPVANNNEATETTTVRARTQPQPTCAGVAATIRGTAASEVIHGTKGRDVITAFRGNDTIYAFGGRDLICAGGGADIVGAGARADRVLAGAGQDVLWGRGGPDRLLGNRGNDLLKGHRGNDVLRGGFGFDRCRPGPGADRKRGCEA